LNSSALVFVSLGAWFAHLDHSWEYPGKLGMSCNVVSADDTANFLTFLKYLRSMEGADDLIISAAVSITPFIGADGLPLKSVLEFSYVLDDIGSPYRFIRFPHRSLIPRSEIMAYDIGGRWSDSVSPNAPLDDSCAPTPQGSVISAVKAWTAAGFPPHKIFVGVAAYGHSFFVYQANAYNKATGKIQPYVPFDNSKQPKGDKWDSTADGVDQCGSPNAVGGVFDFWGLIDAGFLNREGKASPGIDYTFDSCSQTVRDLPTPTNC
jgi:chitinase